MLRRNQKVKCGNKVVSKTNGGISIINSIMGHMVTATGADLGFSKEGGHSERHRREVFRGVWGHAPPENFENLGL